MPNEFRKSSRGRSQTIELRTMHLRFFVNQLLLLTSLLLLSVILSANSPQAIDGLVFEAKLDSKPHDMTTIGEVEYTQKDNVPCAYFGNGSILWTQNPIEGNAPCTISIWTYFDSYADNVLLTRKVAISLGQEQAYQLRAIVYGSIKGVYGKRVMIDCCLDEVHSKLPAEMQWRHCVAVFDGTNAFLYVDGEFIVGEKLSHELNTNKDYLILGGYMSSKSQCTPCWNGFLANARIYNRALSTKEIQMIYQHDASELNLKKHRSPQNPIFSQANTKKQPPEIIEDGFAINDGTMTCSIKGKTFKLVEVEAGSFDMGSTSNEPNDKYNVILTRNYYMGIHEVTQELWEAVMGGNPSEIPGPTHPVEMVSWEEANLFCKKLTNLMSPYLPTGGYFDLPTEAQWEFAARGGIKGIENEYRTSGHEKIDRVAWASQNSSYSHHPVGQKRPNELGIYDMSGNVWEFCQDFHAEYDLKNNVDPQGPQSGIHKIIRGGSWDSAESPYIDVRHRRLPQARYHDVGFRIVYQNSTPDGNSGKSTVKEIELLFDQLQ